MQAKKVVYLFSVLLLLSGFALSVGAQPTNSVSFRGVGVTIDLTFPEEAHPTDSILYNVTIRANTELTLKEFSMVVKMWVNSNWQEIFAPDTYRNIFLPNNYSLFLPMNFQLPPEANGTLQCFMYVRTQRQAIDDASYTFYTTLVSQVTFSELRSEYDKLLANYSRLKADLIDYAQLLTNYSRLVVDYQTLFGEYSELLTNHSSLVTGYETLLDEHNGLLANYSSLLANNQALQSEYSKLLANYSSNVAAHESLLTSYDTLSNDRNSLNDNYKSQLAQYNELETEYDSLNSTRYSIQASYDSLKEVYAALNQTYTALDNEINDLAKKISISEGEANSSRTFAFIALMTVIGLIALIIYLKKKQPEPYVVIRKETVAVNPEEKQQPEQQQ